MFDIHVPCMSTYEPRYIPSKNLFGYLGKFPLGVSFQFFEEHFYVDLSHPPRELNQVSNKPRGIIKAKAISRFLGLELCSWRKAFNYELLLLNNKLNITQLK